VRGKTGTLIGLEKVVGVTILRSDLEVGSNVLVLNIGVRRIGSSRAAGGGGSGVALGLDTVESVHGAHVAWVDFGRSIAFDLPHQMVVADVVVVLRRTVSFAQVRCQRDGDGLNREDVLFLLYNGVCLTSGGDIQARKIKLIIRRIAAEKVVDAAVLLVDHDDVIDRIGIGDLSMGRSCHDSDDEKQRKSDIQLQTGFPIDPAM